MNVLFINPQASNIVKTRLDFDLEISNTGRFPPLGLISLAAFVRKYSHHRVEVLDCDAEKIEPPRVLEYIRAHEIEVVGITVFTFTFYDVLQLARLIKTSFPHIIIVFGGPHNLLFPQDTLSHSEIDYLVIGEGEESFLYLLERLEKKQKPDRVDGLAFRDKGKIFVGKLVWVKDLDKLPLPAYDLLNASRYHSTFGYGGKTITLASSRGCPYLCTFCQKTTGQYRVYSVDYMIEHIKSFYAEGYRNFYFFDDLFSITSARVVEFSKRLRDESLDIKWVFKGRVNSITEELCREASAAGCVLISLGIEDYTNEGLREIKKNITIEQAKTAVAWAKKYKIQTCTNWIIGLPTHKSLSDLDGLLKTSIEMRSDYAMFTILWLLPGCEMFEQAVKEGVLSPSSWSAYVRNPVAGYRMEFYDKYISAEELSRFYTKAHKKYYRRPGYVIRRILELHSFSELMDKLPIAINVLLARKKVKNAR